jgi:serine/threonine protein phosphatase PrpC/Leucine-rich repeat (LRR) protein
MMSANELTETPPLDFGRLTKIDFFVNRLTVVPARIPATCVNLHLGYNDIRSVELAVPGLTRFFIPGNLVDHFSPNCSFPALQNLDISFNHLSELPDLSKICPRLAHLNVSHNFFVIFPAKLPKVLETIDISYNKLSMFEEDLTRFENLQSLNLKGNTLIELPRLPPSLQELTLELVPFEAVQPFPPLKLPSLKFRHAQFTSLPDLHAAKIKIFYVLSSNLTNLAVDCLPARLKILDLSHNAIEVLDPALFRISRLHHLRLSGNRISSVPPTFSQSHLRTLAIARNPLASLPPVPRTLESLDCTQCDFSELPLLNPSMTFVSFASNRLTLIPAVPPARLVVLALNRLTEMPICPPSVHSVDFSHNLLRLFTLTPTMVSADVSHNRLIDVHVADESAGCPSLAVLKLSHNPGCLFVVDFRLYPRLTHVDLCGTQISHPFPIPRTVVDLVLSSPDLQRLAKGTAAKVFAPDVGYSETIGSRDEMEDALVLISGGPWRVYAVVDGHGGGTTAQVVGRFWAATMAAVGFKALADVKTVCIGLQQLLAKKQVQDGAVLAAVVIAERRMCVAHLGDSRVLRVLRDGTVLQLTNDHKASDRREMELIKKSGSFIVNGRVEGHLAVSRALGDFAIRGIGRVPDVATYDLDADDWRIVIACDGVFDVLENGLVARIVREETDVHRAAAVIKHMTIASRSTDNVSVVVVDVSQP